MRCSFCHKAQHVVAKLISSPSDHPRAYICDECVAVCARIIEDDRRQSQGAPDADRPRFTLNSVLDPLALQLFEAIEEWLYQEAGGGDPSAAIGDVRHLAAQLLSR